MSLLPRINIRRPQLDLGSKSGAVAVNASAAETQTLTLTGDVVLTVSGSGKVSLVFTQDATGGHTVTFGGKPVTVDPELVHLLKTALAFSELSDGAFDITYASVGYLYDYRAGRHPDDGQIRSALPAISWRHVILDERASSVRFTQPGVRIDLGGIAKGYACDRAADLLRARGIKHAIVTAGGDSRILGDRRGRPWVVGIRHPDDRKRVIARIPLEDAAISTSGDYERFFDEGGVRYHHIIDPATGRSASDVRSVTVIAADATTTEGLTKSVFVKGPDAGLAFINGLRARDKRYADVDAVIVARDGRVLYSDGLAPPR